MPACAHDQYTTVTDGNFIKEFERAIPPPPPQKKIFSTTVLAWYGLIEIHVLIMIYIIPMYTVRINIPMIAAVSNQNGSSGVDKLP